MVQTLSMFVAESNARGRGYRHVLDTRNAPQPFRCSVLKITHANRLQPYTVEVDGFRKGDHYLPKGEDDSDMEKEALTKEQEGSLGTQWAWQRTQKV